MMRLLERSGFLVFRVIYMKHLANREGRFGAKAN